MKVLVTGAAGFIGSHLCERLASEGLEVIGIDNFDSYYSTSIKKQNVEHVLESGASFSEVDILDFHSLLALTKDFAPDRIAHLAAKAGVRNSILDPRGYVMANLVGTQNVLDAGLAAECTGVVLASTSSVYADAKDMPFDESWPAANPSQPYSASKRAAEMLSSTYHRLYDLNVSVTRFFTVYGPRGRPDMMPYMLAQSMVDGSPVTLFEGPLERDWTYVDDIVDGVIAAIRRPMGFEIFNLGRGTPVPLSDFIQELELISGRKANIVPVARPDTEMLVTYANTRKSKELLDFKAEVPISDGVRRFWEWFEARHSAD